MAGRDSQEMTFHGLCQWYDHTFAKFGWIVLKNAGGHSEAVEHYRKELNHLIQSLTAKSKTVVADDKATDLTIMADHLKTLQNALVACTSGRSASGRVSRYPASESY